EAEIADTLSHASRDVINTIKEVGGGNVFLYDADLRDPVAVEKIFKDENFTAVIHCAGLKAVGESVKKPLDYYRSNLDITLTLLEAMSRGGVRRLIFSSSATVYGNPADPCYTEDLTLTEASSPYGNTKILNERLITDFAKTNENFSAVLLRYFNPVGAHPSGLLGENPKGTPNNLFPYMAKVAKGELPELEVFGNDYGTRDGTPIRDYLHVVDLAKGHVKAFDYTIKNKGVHAFNLGRGEGSSVLECVAAFEKASGKSIPYKIGARRDGDLPEYWANPAKAKEILGWSAELTLDDMCRDAWNFANK
ncbi:MAG: UDP-glucose 4-epimerase GalE, partial [Oscillospiraceae bacterium]|nr:UDP-glucose 4-epimerase GalE [Oscillospiraceae bacterium]